MVVGDRPSLASPGPAGRSAQAEAARAVLVVAGQMAAIEVRDDETAAQRGAALALFADCAGGVRLGADGAGAPGRPAEAIGRTVARQLLEELKSGAAVDRFAANQLIPFAALAHGESRFTIPHVTEHVQASEWLVQTILGAGVRVEDHWVVVAGVGFSRS